MQARWLAGLALALFSAHSAWAALATTWEMDFDDEKKDWKELEAQLPPYPKGNLVQLQMGAASPHRFYLDPASVALGADGVMRYTAVVRTGGGAENVTFEGMRCETRELKIYATGHKDGTWSRARLSQWDRVQRYSKPFQYTLYREYFCPEHSRPTPPKQALDAMRYNRPLGSSAGDE